MKVLVIVDNGRVPEMYLLNIIDNRAMKDIKRLIGQGARRQAMELVLCKGVIEKVIEPEEFPMVDCDLILSERWASWDLMGKLETGTG